MSRPDRFTPGREAQYLFDRRLSSRPAWMGMEDLPPIKFEPRTVQPVASRYTDCNVLTFRHVDRGAKWNKACKYRK